MFELKENKKQLFEEYIRTIVGKLLISISNTKHGVSPEEICSKLHDLDPGLTLNKEVLVDALIFLTTTEFLLRKKKSTYLDKLLIDSEYVYIFNSKRSKKIEINSATYYSLLDKYKFDYILLPYCSGAYNVTLSLLGGNCNEL